MTDSTGAALEMEGGDDTSFMPELSADEKAYFDRRGESSEGSPSQKPSESAHEPGSVEAGAAPPASAPREDEEGDKQDMVPHGRFHRERERREQTEVKLRQLEIEHARVQERQAIFERMQQKPQEAPPPPPAHEEDIFRAAQYDRQRIEQMEQKISAYERQQQQERAEGQLVQYVSSLAQNYAKTERPDFGDAYRHYVGSRYAELTAFGRNDAQARAIIQQEEKAYYASELRNKRNPLAGIYAAAQARGYRPGQAAPNGEADKIASLNAANQTQRSLGASSSGRQGGNISVDDLLNMDGDAYDKFKKDHPGQFRKLMGG